MGVAEFNSSGGRLEGPCAGRGGAPRCVLSRGTAAGKVGEGDDKAVASFSSTSW